MTRLSSPEMLTRLARASQLPKCAPSAGLSREQFDDWWRASAAPASLPPRACVGSTVRAAESKSVATAGACRTSLPKARAISSSVSAMQPRRIDSSSSTTGDARRAAGWRKSWDETLESDILYRTLGLAQAADAEWAALPAGTRDRIAAYSAGVNALIEQSHGRLPIEFDLLGYEPEPWKPEDCVVLAKEVRWYMTGRLPVIVIPELAKRALGQGPLYREFLRGEADDESIVPPGSYSGAASRRPARRVRWGGRRWAGQQ